MHMEDRAVMGNLLNTDGGCGDGRDERMKEAVRVLVLFLTAGVALEQAHSKVAELFSPPRLIEHVQDGFKHCLSAGSTFDLQPDASGQRAEIRPSPTKGQG